MKSLSVVVVVSSLLLWTVGFGSAQDAAPVRVEGRVTWRAGQTAIIAPDGKPSVNIDLSQVPQDLDFALGALNWLLAREELIGIAPKVASFRARRATRRRRSTTWRRACSATIAS